MEHPLDNHSPVCQIFGMEVSFVCGFQIIGYLMLVFLTGLLLAIGYWLLAIGY